MSYTHLSQDERYQIQCLLQLGQRPSEIARKLHRHPSTISREIARHGGPDGYQAHASHLAARARQSQRRNARQITDQQWALVLLYLQLGLSPEQVPNRLRLELRPSVSCSCIYKRLHSLPPSERCKISPRCGHPRKPRPAAGVGQLPDRVGIEQRPALVQQRQRLGDWEGDTIVSGKHGLAALVTLTERRSRYSLAALVPRRQAEPVAEKIIEMLRPHKLLCHTLTLDNGKEFAQHGWIGRCLGMQVYFADPHSPWQRGLNENHNGLLRHDFPKGCDFSKVSEQQVLDAVYRLNHRPRKCLGWKTPHEVFHGFEIVPLTLTNPCTL